MWTINFYKSFSKKNMLYMSSRLSKIRYLHTFILVESVIRLLSLPGFGPDSGSFVNLDVLCSWTFSVHPAKSDLQNCCLLNFGHRCLNYSCQLFWPPYIKASMEELHFVCKYFTKIMIQPLNNLLFDREQKF